VVGKHRITIVGIGNEFRGDDAVALLVAKNLRDLLPEQVKVVELTGDQSDLIELMQETNSMIIIDAIKSTAPSGTIFHIDAGKESFPDNFFNISSHGIDLAQSIELVRTMKKLPKVVLIYGIAGKDFSFTTSSSQQVKDAAEIVRNRILNDIDRILETPET